MVVCADLFLEAGLRYISISPDNMKYTPKVVVLSHVSVDLTVTLLKPSLLD